MAYLTEATEYSRIVKTTLNKVVPELADETIRETALLLKMRNRNRLVMDESGSQLEWTVKYKKRPLTPYADEDEVSYARRDLYQKAYLPWRGYVKTDRVTLKEQRMNRGKEAFVKIFANMLDDMKTETKDQLSRELFVDGNATGYTKQFHGLESWFGQSGSTSVAAGVAEDSYAGLNTILGFYGGSSVADAEYCFWTPTLYNTKQSAGGIIATSGRALTALRYLINRTQLGATRDLNPDLALTTKAVYEKLQTVLQAEERYLASGKEMLEAGIKSLSFDGVDVVTDLGLTSNVLYVLNTSQLWLHMLQGDLFEGRSGFDEQQLAFWFEINCWGNLRTQSPRYHGKAYDIA